MSIRRNDKHRWLFSIWTRTLWAWNSDRTIWLDDPCIWPSPTRSPRSCSVPTDWTHWIWDARRSIRSRDSSRAVLFETFAALSGLFRCRSRLFSCRPRSIYSTPVCVWENYFKFLSFSKNLNLHDAFGRVFYRKYLQNRCRIRWLTWRSLSRFPI